MQLIEWVFMANKPILFMISVNRNCKWAIWIIFQGKCICRIFFYFFNVLFSVCHAQPVEWPLWLLCRVRHLLALGPQFEICNK